MASKIDIQLNSKFNGGGVKGALAAFKNLTKGATDIKSAFSMAFGSVSKAASGVGKVLMSAFRFETQAAQFKVLVGSMDEAKRHMQDLKALGDTPPFGLDEFAKASRAMLSMTDGVMGYKKSLEMVGDTAAATGRPLEEVARAVGRAFAFIRDGGEIMTAVEMLRTMGAVTPAVVQEMREMQKAGASNAEIWAKVEEQLSRFKGAMAETEKTGEGLISAIQSRWDNIVRTLGQAFEDTAKDGLGEVLDQAKRLEEDGSVEAWARSSMEYLRDFAEGAKAVLSPVFSVLGGAWKTLKGSFQSVGQSVGNFVGTLAGGGGLGEAFKAGGRGFKQGWVDAFDSDGAEADHRERIKAEYRERREARRREKELAAAEREAAEQLRIEEALIKAEEEKKVKAAKVAAEKAAEAEKKAAEAAAKERERLDLELHQKRMQHLRDEMAAASGRSSALTTTAQNAASEFDRAFAMYRDPAQAASVIGEEQAYQNDLKRLHRDASRYGGKWRIDELSRLMAAGDSQGVTDTLQSWRKSRSFTPEVEAMVRASAAERTKTTAEEELRKIENNTAGLAKKLDELLAMKGG